MCFSQDIKVVNGVSGKLGKLGFEKVGFKNNIYKNHHYKIVLS
jgi:hypothetical protein